MIRALVLWLPYKIPHTTIMVHGKPYLTRYYLLGGPRDGTDTRPFNLFLHHFHASDQDRELHNHPWPGISLILRGGYVEERCSMQTPKGLDFTLRDWYTPVTTRTVRPGMFNRIGLKDFHRAQLLDEGKGAWTLFLAGRRCKSWGFLDPKTGVYTDWRKNPEAIP